MFKGNDENWVPNWPTKCHVLNKAIHFWWLLQAGAAYDTSIYLAKLVNISIGPRLVNDWIYG